MGRGEPLLVWRAVPTSWAPHSEAFIHRGPTPSCCGSRGQHFLHPVLRNLLNHIQHPLISHVLASRWQLGHKWPLKASSSPPSRDLFAHVSQSPQRKLFSSLWPEPSELKWLPQCSPSAQLAEGMKMRQPQAPPRWENPALWGKADKDDVYLCHL